MNSVIFTRYLTETSFRYWKTIFGILAIVGLSMTVGKAQDAKVASVSRSTVTELGFRVDADIYADESKPPIAQFKTLFTENRSIEIDAVSGDTVVVDVKAGIIQAFSASKRTMTEIKLAEVDTLVKNILAASAQQPITITNDNGILVVDDSIVQYRVTPQAPQLPTAADRYLEFADWTTRLAAVFPPYKPPQLRLRLNDHLKGEKVLPLETRRLTKSSHQEIVSKLIVNYSLSIDDKKEIDRVASLARDYKIVNAKDFFVK